MTRPRLSLHLSLALALLFAASAMAIDLPNSAEENLAALPIQSGGRVMTFDAYSRDLVHEITGEHQLDGEEPLATVVRWISNPQQAYAEPLFPLIHEPLRRAIGLDGSDPTRFSMETLVGMERLVEIAEQSQLAQQQDEDLTIEQGKAAEVFNRVSALHGLLTATDLRLIPAAAGSREWRSIATVMADSTAPGATVALAWTGLREAAKRGNAEMVETSARVLHEELYAWHGESVDHARLKAELLYRGVDPWALAKGLYIAVILVAIVASFVSRRWLEAAPRLLLLVGFLVHTGGLALRWYVAQRAPWSNMYESLITIAWGVVLFGLFKYRGAASKVIAPAAAFVGFSSLFIAGQAYLDPSIDPLVPALQSYWLNIHVIVILLGYASAVLAAIFGHMWIANDVFRPGKAKKLMTGLFNAGYRMVQFAVLFLIVGILLGSVWAHEAWGRYWGWDPKETWALITWMYYLGMIHAGYAGWLRERGLAVMNVIGLTLVLMTYYGVNYFLSGLHTYASGSAVEIPPTVIVFLSLEALILVAYGAHRYFKGRDERARRRQRRAEARPNTA